MSISVGDLVVAQGSVGMVVSIERHEWIASLANVELYTAPIGTWVFNVDHLRKLQ